MSDFDVGKIFVELESVILFLLLVLLKVMFGGCVVCECFFVLFFMMIGCDLCVDFFIDNVGVSW